MHVNRSRKLRSETERGGRKGTLDPVTPAGQLCDSKPNGNVIGLLYNVLVFEP